MTDDLARFLGRHTPSVRQWERPIEAWASFALERVLELTSWRPQQHELLLAAVRDIHSKVTAPGSAASDEIRGLVARRAGFVHVMASWLHREAIPACELEACSAAEDVDQAAMQILSSMGGDYGLL